MNIIRSGLFFLVLLLSGCSSSPPLPPEKAEVPPTVVNTKITVSGQVNPDIDNRASPIVVRMFDLKSLGTFNESDFYGLFDNYESVLGSDLLGSEQFHLNPGVYHTLKHSTAPGTQYIALIAAYRDLNQAAWRDYIVLPAGKEIQMMVFVDKLAISVWRK
jgi:type VI secretion system protein VasD